MCPGKVKVPTPAVADLLDTSNLTPVTTIDCVVCPVDTPFKLHEFPDAAEDVSVTEFCVVLPLA